MALAIFCKWQKMLISTPEVRILGVFKGTREVRQFSVCKQPPRTSREKYKKSLGIWLTLYHIAKNLHSYPH